jgi:hypothetical protein
MGDVDAREVPTLDLTHPVGCWDDEDSSDS